MDPFSITVGAIGITTTALHCVRNLIEFIDKVANAPDNIKDIKKDLEAVDGALASLQTTLSSLKTSNELNSLIENVKIGVAVKNCGAACDNFQKTLAKWTRHSTESKMFWWDKLNTGYFKETKIKVFVDQLDSCKNTINVALNTFTFINSCRTAQLTEESKKEKLGVLEKEIQQNETVVYQQTTRVGGELQQLIIVGEVEEPLNDDEEPSREELVADVKHHQQLLDVLKSMCHEAKERTREERTGQDFRNVELKNSRMLVGMFNTKVDDQKFHDIKATDSSGVIGAANLDVNAFLGNVLP